MDDYQESDGDYQESNGDYQESDNWQDDSIINKYKKIEDLHEGAYGTMSIVEDENGFKRVRKIQKYTNQSKMEANILSICDHPNIIRLIEMSIEDDYVKYMYFILEYGGQDLASFIRNAPLDIRNQYDSGNLWFIAYQIANGIEYLHNKGIVHCDIKPGNIVIDNYNVKIIDFGCSLILNEINENSVILCTPQYSAPENSHLDLIEYKNSIKSIDIWSLGCLYFELFTGNKLFDQDTKELVFVEMIKIFGMPIYKGVDLSRYEQFRPYSKQKVIFDDHIDKCFLKEDVRLLINSCINYDWNKRRNIENIKEQCECVLDDYGIKY